MVLGLSLLLCPRWALAVDDGDRNAARSLAGQAKEMFDRGDYAKAADLFHRAYTLVQAPTISLFEARALVKLGRWVEAEEAYTRTLRTPLDGESSEQFRKAVREAEPELAALQPRIPRLTIVLSGSGARDPGLQVALDGEPVKSALLGVEMPVNPGSHTLTARAGNAAATEESLTLLEKERRSVELEVAAPLPVREATPLAALGPRRDLAPPPAADPSSPWQLKAAFVAGGIGVVGLGTGIVTGLMASSRYRAAESECPAHTCVSGSTGDDAVQSFRSLKAISTVGYIAGGIGLAAGVTLFVMAPSNKAPSRAALGVFVNGEQAGVVGAF